MAERMMLSPDPTAAWRTTSWNPVTGCDTCHALILAGIDWVTVAGEVGRGVRPMHPDWVRDVRDRAGAASVPFLFLQWGGSGPGARGRSLDGRTWDERPAPTATAA